MMRYMVIDNDKIINIVNWDGQSDWSPPNGAKIVKMNDDEIYGVGGKFVDNEYVPPSRDEF